MSAVQLQVAGETLMLLPQKALYWPARQALVVADIHFGKAAAFRALGVPVPRGTTSENLDALDALMARHAVREIVFLGDFLHARAAHASATLQAMLAWRRRHPALLLTLVRGNHDRRAGDPAADLGITLVDEPQLSGPFAVRHHPGLASEAYTLAGHVHPTFLLANRFDALRLPCFVVGERGMVLPSFGAFTGGFPVSQAAGERIYVCSGEAVHLVR